MSNKAKKFTFINADYIEDDGQNSDTYQYSAGNHRLSTPV